ncbi:MULTISPECIES: hypothetical protein [unclassified Rhizobium]|nr:MULTISPECIES: hypothetical protein [unclassified Rhizobium]
MTARDVLLLMVTAFFLTALLLIHNAFYRPVSTSAVEPPAKVHSEMLPYG